MLSFCDDFGTTEVFYYIADFDLPSTVSRLERLDHLAQKFKHKCDIHEEWTTGKEGQLQAQDFKQCRLNELKVRPVAPPPLRSYRKFYFDTEMVEVG